MKSARQRFVRGFQGPASNHRRHMHSPSPEDGAKKISTLCVPVPEGVTSARECAAEIFSELLDPASCILVAMQTLFDEGPARCGCMGGKPQRVQQDWGSETTVRLSVDARRANVPASSFASPRGS